MYVCTVCMNVCMNACRHKMALKDQKTPTLLPNMIYHQYNHFNFPCASACPRSDVSISVKKHDSLRRNEQVHKPSGLSQAQTIKGFSGTGCKILTFDQKVLSCSEGSYKSFVVQRYTPFSQVHFQVLSASSKSW